MGLDTESWDFFLRTVGAGAIVATVKKATVESDRNGGKT
jgi:hypothetical protein